MSTSIKEHPTIVAHRQKLALEKLSEPLDAEWLRQLCLNAGADDVGFVEIGRMALAEEKPHIQRAFPHTRSLISFVLRMNRDNVRSPARSVANSEFITRATKPTTRRGTSWRRWRVATADTKTDTKMVKKSSVQLRRF